jgi:hypothetical protein
MVCIYMCVCISAGPYNVAADPRKQADHLLANEPKSSWSGREERERKWILTAPGDV